MIVVVPMAGPDFEGSDGFVKAEREIEGLPLLRRALDSRPWRDDVAQLVFVLRDTARSRQFAAEKLATWYPQAQIAYLSDGTVGAAFSVCAGVALIRDLEAPLVIDLCDLLFQTEGDLAGLFASDKRLGGLAVTFLSDRPKYSYLTFGTEGDMIEAREKVVISSNASAGLYAFRSSSVFLHALSHSVRNRTALAHNGALFVCPMLNGVVEQGLAVRGLSADAVIDVADVIFPRQSGRG